MVHRRTYKDIVWIDLESPTASEVRPLIKTYNIHPLVADELIRPSLKPKVDFYGEHIYCILHFPALKHSHNGSPDQEIDFVIGKNFLITTHYDTIDPLHKFSKIFEVNSTLDKNTMGDHAGYIFYYMLKRLYRSAHHELERINTTLRSIEEAIFKGKERDMVIELSKIARDMLTIKRTLALHQNVLASLHQPCNILFGAEYDFYLRDMESEYTKVNYALNSESEFLYELRSTNDSLLSTKQNEITKTLTLIALMVLPASLIATIFSMRTEHLPIVGTPYDFVLILGVMIAAGLSAFLIFKQKKWL